ncbi:MAG: TonB family protein [Deltaproteobacteria bacterium]|nr:TonB family protein [Deltaproteobacteria bacterium]
MLLHSSALGPLVALAVVFGAREAAERAEEVDVSWKQVDPDTLPQDLPPLSPEEPLPTKDRTAQAKPKDEDVKPEPKPEEPKPEETKPEPKVAEVPTPQEPPPPPPPQVERRHEKMVELDPDKEDPPPENANFLANKNSRAEQETMARETNLERERKAAEVASSPSNEKDDKPGDAENKIAQLEQTPSKAGRRAPNTTPSANPREAAAPSKPAAPSVLSMRSEEKFAHTITPETVNQFLPRSKDGVIAMPERNLRSMQDMQSKAGPQTDARFKLSADDYDYLFGQDDQAAKALAQKARSSHKGKFTQRLEQGRSALENFIPEVKPGNQTALNARAAPFAAFIAGMHRNIHELWGWGFLSDLEGRSPSDPLNNLSLWTRLEIVLNADGTINNVKVIRTSGLSMFDVAAVDVIHSAGPYPEPPREIRSANGKIYLHWAFHRDERQCATFGADPFILNNPGESTDQSSNAFSMPAAPKVPGRALPAPKQLSRTQVPTGHASEESMETPPQAQPELSRPDDPLARHAAEGFFLGLARGDAGQMVKWAGFPFHSSAGSTAPSAGVLQGQLQGLLDELPNPHKLRSLNVYTSGGLRNAGLKPPAAFSTNPKALYAIALIGGETIIAPLLPQMGAWKVVGLFR